MGGLHSIQMASCDNGFCKRKLRYTERELADVKEELEKCEVKKERLARKLEFLYERSGDLLIRVVAGAIVQKISDYLGGKTRAKRIDDVDLSRHCGHVKLPEIATTLRIRRRDLVSTLETVLTERHKVAHLWKPSDQRNNSGVHKRIMDLRDECIWLCRECQVLGQKYESHMLLIEFYPELVTLLHFR